MAPDSAGMPVWDRGDQRPSIRRVLSWSLVGALCVAALTAIVAILSGDFDETDGRVIATSLGFAVFSATAASGASLRFRSSENLRTLGLATMVLSVVSFLLLLVVLWNDGSDQAWRWFGAAVIAALATSHASLVCGALRASDTPAVRALATASITLAAIDSFFGILAISEAVHDVDERFGQLMAALVVLLLLSTALPPILRRLGRPAVVAPPTRRESTGSNAPTRSIRRAARSPLADDLLAAVDRIEALNADPADRAPEIRRECERLREMARAHSV